jgi:hypothetical protein
MAREAATLWPRTVGQVPIYSAHTTSHKPYDSADVAGFGEDGQGNRGTCLARIVVPGLVHHVTQRGNRCQAIFCGDGDLEIYRDLLAEPALKAGVEVWVSGLVWCLRSSHRKSRRVRDDEEQATAKAKY